MIIQYINELMIELLHVLVCAVFKTSTVLLQRQQKLPKHLESGWQLILSSSQFTQWSFLHHSKTSQQNITAKHIFLRKPNLTRKRKYIHSRKGHSRGNKSIPDPAQL
jgi:hypothetical protein